MEKILLSLKDASAGYGVAVPTLRVLIRKGRLPVVRCGRRILIRKAVLDWRSEAENLAEPAPQEASFQKGAAGAPISLDKTERAGLVL
jgi:excisionase family DNA binding protein